MDFLKSAVASAISKGPAFPYSFDDRIDVDGSIWTLHNSTKREDGSKCSVFSFDITANRSWLPLARNALRKLKTLRHPGVIKLIDSVETETYIYIATERLTPLNWHIRRNSLSQETIKWGLHGIAKTIRFINGDASSIHGCIRASSVFTTESGEWKLGGFEALSSMKEDDAVIFNYGSLTPDSARYSPPEVAKTGWEAVRRYPIHAPDSFAFGILTYEAFNAGFSSTEQLTQPKLIPVGMQTSYKRLISANPKVRISVGQFLEQGVRSGGFFETPLIQLTDGVENLGLKSEAERDEFLSQLDDVSDDFPEDFLRMKVLPELLKSVEFGGGGPKVFAVIMKISIKLSDEEYERLLNPVIVRLFSSQDRAIRVCLLDNLSMMIDHLSQKIVSNNIFPQLVMGFSDIAPIVREQTVKSVLVIIPKLTDRIINGELLRHLAKTANDEQPGIRTNTTICLGKIAKHLGSGSRAKVLNAAFARALRDPFDHARNAALMALAATTDVFSDEDCASKILPGICPSLIDKEKFVRDQANKTLEIYLHRVRKYAQSLPETTRPVSGTTGANAANPPRMGTPQSDTSWAGWAISSFTNKIGTASGQMQADSNGSAGVAPAEPRSSSEPPSTSGLGRLPGSNISLLGLTSQPSKSPTANPFTTAAVAATAAAAGTRSTALQRSEAGNTTFDMGWDDDGDNAWGAGAGEDENQNDPDFDPFAPKPSKSSSAPVAFDDNGEPDFEGWLNAKAQGKQTSKKPLPKGLAKSSTTATAPATAASRPGLGVKSKTSDMTGLRKSIVTNSSASRATAAVTAAKKPAAKVVSKPKPAEEEEEEEGWGDEWD